jgi:hypothetical protein
MVSMREAKIKYPSNDRQSELRRMRMEREEAQKSAGVWGEMSVALISKGDSVFVYCLKGNRQPDLYSFAVKKPKDWEDAEYDALMVWLRANKFEGFTQSFTAWNLSAAESQRVKGETLTKLQSDGRTAINSAVVST